MPRARGGTGRGWPAVKTGPKRGPRPRNGPEERQERHDHRQEQRPEHAQERRRPVAAIKNRRHDEPGERAQKADQPEAEIIGNAQAGHERPEAVAELGVEPTLPQPPDQPERMAERPEEMPEPAAPGARHGDMQSEITVTTTRPIRQSRATAPCRVDQLGRAGVRTRRARRARATARSRPPGRRSRAARRTPTKPSRSRPIRATRADDSRK